MNGRATPKNLVIYADDDIDDIEMVKEGFNEFANDVELEIFNDGDEVVEYLKAQHQVHVHPCLVILDINMPRLNGLDTLIEIRKYEEFENLPIIIFSTSTRKHDMQFAEQNKAGFITKPIDIKQLTIIINNFVDHCKENVRSTIRKQEVTQ